MKFNLLEEVPYDVPLDDINIWLKIIPARQYLKLVEKEEPDLLDWYLLKRIKDKDSSIRFEDAVFTLMYNIKKNDTIQPNDIREAYNYIGEKLFSESRFNFVVNELKEISLNDFIDYFYYQIDEKHPNFWSLYKTLLNTELSGMVDPSTNMIKLSIHSEDLAKYCKEFGASSLHSFMIGEAFDCFNYDWSDFSYTDAGYAVRDLSTETEKTIKDKFGITKEQLEKVVNQDKEIKEKLGVDKVDAIASALSVALARGEESGSVHLAERDFEQAIDNILPSGSKILSEWADPMIVGVPKDAFLSPDIMKNIAETDISYGFDESTLVYALIENFNFDEPYYGWQEFDQEAFEDELVFRLDEEL